MGNVCPGEAVVQRQRQDTVAPFRGEKIGDKLHHWAFARGGEEAHYLAVEESHDRLDLAGERSLHQLEKIVGALAVVDMRIGLVEDDEVGGLDEPLIDVGMQV